jgi:prolyl-tRNA editing enzyme YbaK/EbsC (Cys-tRNA(Pro) deacylase)
MSYEKVKEYFNSVGLGGRVIIREHIIDTVENAAKAIGCEPAHIAKTMSFLQNGTPVLIVTAGDAKIDNTKYKARFHQKAVMIPNDQVEAIIGHEPGAICPYEINEGIQVFMDVSLKRFELVHTSGGNQYSTVSLSPDELETHSASMGWIDVCKGWE